ncbi:MAG: hypothetical protein RLZZ546_915 [Bacteroidota bacterium]|jgi:hypothetical protein
MNISFDLDNNGSKIFSSQVEKARKEGFSTIKTYAAAGENYNGYYTWARLGYKPTKESEKVLKNEFIEINKKYNTSFKNLEHAMESEEGRKIWRENGISFYAEFDQKSTSYSSKTLKNYLEKRS